MRGDSLQSKRKSEDVRAAIITAAVLVAVLGRRVAVLLAARAGTIIAARASRDHQNFLDLFASSK